MPVPSWTIGVMPAVSIGTCTALAFGGYGVFGLDAPFSPAFAQAPGQTGAMVLRAGLLFAILVMPADAPGATGRARIGALVLVGTLFLLSLVARGALSLFILGALGDLAWLGRRKAAGPAPRIHWLVLGAYLVLLGLAGTKRQPAQPTESDARSLTSLWRARGNPWRTRWYALAWASTESPPGEAYLALAEANWELGRRDKARHVLSKVLAGEAPETTRHHAEAVLQVWNR